MKKDIKSQKKKDDDFKEEHQILELQQQELQLKLEKNKQK